MKKYIFVATAWSAKNGGINAFNYDLCSAIAKTLNIALIVEEIKEEDSSKIAAGVNILCINDGFISMHKHVDKIKTKFDLKKEDDVFWIGHDAITGGVANFLKGTLGGVSVVFHHMDYSNYYYLKSKDTSIKISTQRKIIKESDVVIAVGPRLMASAKSIRSSHAETYAIIPGCPISAKRGGKFNNRIVVCGRLDEKEDAVKNCTPALVASIKLLSRNIENKGSVTLIGVNPSEIRRPKGDQQYNSVAVNAVPYISDRSGYFEEICSADILLMPSVKEGFGLVAWEAACLGIPILISKSSGLYELLCNLGVSDLVISVVISGNKYNDELAIGDALGAALSDPGYLFKNASSLAEKLKIYTWDQSSYQFLSYLGGVSNNIENTALIEFGSKKVERVQKIKIDRNSPSSFERFEDVLSIAYKKRNIVFPKSETTDYSRGQRVKYEFWEVKSLTSAYVLYIAPGINISQTIKHFSIKLKASSLNIKSLYILRRDKGEHKYIEKIFAAEGCVFDVNETTLKDYIWENCIDESFKNQFDGDVLENYIDQSIKYDVSGGIVASDSAKNTVIEYLINKGDFSAHLIVAPGGMGKTWLCRSVAQNIRKNMKDRIVVFIQAENIRNYFSEVGYAHVQVNNIFDLYEIHSRSERDDVIYDRSTFELAVMSGNVVVIIDGLDELAGILQERFNLVEFLGSVREASISLNSSQVLLTIRDNLLINDSYLIEFDIKKYELLGFLPGDWRRYSKNRFAAYVFEGELSAKLDGIISSSNLKDTEGRVIPFFIDVVCNIIEDAKLNSKEDSFILSEDGTPYPSNNESIDAIVYSIFRREMRRQDVDIGINDLLDIVCEIISENGDNFSSDVLRTHLSFKYDVGSGNLCRKISLNPIFEIQGNVIRLRYSFLQAYFRALFIISVLPSRNASNELIIALAKSNSIESPEISYVKKFYQNRVAELDGILFEILPKIRAYIHENKEKDAKRVEAGRRAISCIIRIYSSARSFGGAKMSEKICEFLRSNGTGGRNIDGLCIYGDFLPLDFSETVVMNSYFVDYKSFAKSKFRGSKFMYSTFIGCAGDQIPDDSMSDDIFDVTCQLGDISRLIENVKEKINSSQNILESECLIFLRSFIKSGSRFDPKKSWIKFSNKINGLGSSSFDNLIPQYLNIKSRKSDETYYAISDNFWPSVRKFVDNNQIDVKMKDFFAFIK